ncbi:phage minor head protein [Beggiatoa leptomitoformis]|nr:phage minor head protein [Beggiatoa leptomitoformis]
MSLPNFRFQEPNAEAVAYLAQKKIGKTTFDWRDVWKEEHLNNFVVAKAMQLDVLTTIHESLHQAIEKGLPFSQFKKDLQPKLEALGWWGKGQMTDPKTGEIRDVQLGSPHRLHTIYRTNKDMAYAASKWKRIEEREKDFPYLVYRIGVAKEHRPEHVKLDGLCLPVRHPIWKIIYPPNGWLCHCDVDQITKRQYEKYLKEGIDSSIGTQEIDPETGLPTGHATFKKIPLQTTAPKLEMVDWYNSRTGKMEKIPKGIDAGFDYNVGLANQARLGSLTQTLTEKIKVAPPAIAKPFAMEMIKEYNNLYKTNADLMLTEQKTAMTLFFSFIKKLFSLGE